MAVYTYHGQHNMDGWGMLPDASVYIVRTSIVMDGACLLNARASIDGATGKLMNFIISAGLSHLISRKYVDLAAPHCDSI